MSKFLTVEQRYNRIDRNTGEVVEQYNSKEVVLKQTEPFFLTYSRQILALYRTDILNATTKVLYKMLEFSEWNTGKVYMTTDRIEEVMQTCDISRASYQRAVRELMKFGIISKGKGSYTIAEDMFWKGEIKMRDKVRNAKMKVGFTPVLDNPEEYIEVLDGKVVEN